MRCVQVVVVTALVVGGMGVVRAEEGHEPAHEHAHDHGAVAAHEAAASAEQTLTGEVVDVFCYLSHPAQGLGKDHAGCAKKCIKGGLPVAIKVGDQLYLATMADHIAANEKLAELAAQQVTVTGTVMELDGQHLIAISKIESAN
ncbi:MAG TPA: hypothetical protein DDX89_08005 [Candidatus Omnitrophica bacterium]|nr:MAG: hypothetical protein A2Z92_05245 [Omnitrophica WOR_2 bacterium GWA2_63_20]OGX15294.1 MAG: hypothetical protein A2105_04250 [Omnitrophica WOR_2 bacterium GWF2_63_9]OGX33272.1 MAG: hypothetical protein A3E56_01590 [Omnitrophica WOR_2 bacterium RIFCSPHIGHO2_12_FULL_64_13]OGX36192.1 MAG: hypothetical protein A3B73_01745 [Omnitrophica WOR_2 bacterium RIFCSPHIGHO2_02_FULL_63_39]OGX45601.1 MAG: hypothetical protein A3I71_01980 [Omnitrophica WOR_2 bacterium RIFCSPLOWO2_02_FULL_63_16]OGX48483.1